MRTYELDDADARFELLPLAARRALDCAGLKLSLVAWKALSVELRKQLVGWGSEARVDVQAVIGALRAAGATPDVIPPRPEPDAREPSEAVRAAYGTTRPIPGATWSALSPVDRYALAKVAEKARPERLESAYREIVGASAQSTHLEAQGGVRMVDVGSKERTHRTAIAESRVRLNEVAFANLRANNPKGDVLATARLAGIMAAKKTWDLIPLCHPLALTKLSVDLSPQDAERAVMVTARAECFERTGVEMEAMTAASVAALTIYDMLKAFDRGIEIGPTRLVAKTGGRSGDFRA